jgi:hypothetical protein
LIAVVFQTSEVSPRLARQMVTAINAQVVHDFAPAWSRLPSKPILFDSIDDVPPKAPLIRVVDVSDEPDALGYHTQVGGRVVGIVGVRTVLDAGGSLVDGDLSVSACLSHEVLEAHVDPWANVWVDSGRRQFAFEVCDPVQDTSYDVLGVAVANFVLPRWFDAQARTGPVDHLGKLTRPFSISTDGYAIVRDVASAKVSQLGRRPSWKPAGGRGAHRGNAVGDP